MYMLKLKLITKLTIDSKQNYSKNKTSTSLVSPVNLQSVQISLSKTSLISKFALIIAHFLKNKKKYLLFKKRTNRLIKILL